MASFDSQIFTPVEPVQPVMWGAIFEQQMMASYNQMFQPTTDFYSTTDSSLSASPSSDGSSSPPPHRRISKDATEVRGTVPDKVERRREQNRQSQRAYRDRKEKHQRELEGQIAVWKQKHEELVKSYANRTKEVAELKAQIEDLNAQVASLQSGLPDTWTQADQQAFDLAVFYDKKTGVWGRDSFDS